MMASLYFVPVSLSPPISLCVLASGPMHFLSSLLECISFSSSRSLVSSGPYPSLVRQFLLIYSSFGILSILLTYDMPEKQGLKKNRLSSFFAAEFLVWKSTRNIVDAQ